MFHSEFQPNHIGIILFHQQNVLFGKDWTCSKLYKQGNRLTRRPCKGDEFEIVIFEGKRENAGICRSRQKMCTTWTFISIGRRVTQEWKFEFRLRGDSIFLFKGEKKNIRILWF